ncbi:MAG: hypothetical protein ACREX8_01095, partial [Gammaproteobacteria bacterium]
TVHGSRVSVALSRPQLEGQAVERGHGAEVAMVECRHEARGPSVCENHDLVIREATLEVAVLTTHVGCAPETRSIKRLDPIRGGEILDNATCAATPKRDRMR